MIIFSGEISNINIKKTIKRNTRQAGFIFLGITIISLIATIVLAIINDASFLEFLVLTIILAAETTYLLISPMHKNRLRFRDVFTIHIDSENIVIAHELVGKKFSKPISKVTSVIDMDDFFYLCFGWDLSKG